MITSIEELKVGTKLRTAAAGIFLYEILAISAQGRYKVGPCLVGQQKEIPAAWLDEQAIRDHYFLANPTPNVGAPAGFDARGPDGAAAQPVGDMAPTIAEIARGLEEIAYRVEKLGLFDLQSVALGTLQKIERREQNIHERIIEIQKTVADTLSGVVPFEQVRDVLEGTTTVAAEPRWDLDGTACAYCHSGNLDVIEDDWEGDQGWQQVKCLDCRRRYVMIYELSRAHEQGCYEEVISFTQAGRLLHNGDQIRTKLENLRSLIYLSQHVISAGPSWVDALNDVLDLIPAHHEL